jgi:hypothetical protein
MSSPKKYTETSRLPSQATTYPYLTIPFAVYVGQSLRPIPISASTGHIIASWLVSLCTYRIRELDSVYGSDDIYRTARSLYRCRLSCKDAFPSSLMQDDWVEEVWKEVCYRTVVDPSPNLSRQDEEACLFFVIYGTTSLGFSVQMQ